MNRVEYLQELSKYLKNLPSKDYEDAMNYFEEYFEDVGNEGEADLIKELGSPRTVATEILSKLLTEDRPVIEREKEPVENGREKGKEDKESRENKKDEKGSQDEEEYKTNSRKKENGMRRKFREARTKNSLGKVVLITVLCILAAPIGIPLTAALIALVFSLLILVLSLIVALGVSSVAGIIASVKYWISGVILFHSSIGGALLTIGIGLLLLVFSLFAILIMVSCYKFIVYLLKGLVSKIKQGGGKENEAY